MLILLTLVTLSYVRGALGYSKLINEIIEKAKADGIELENHPWSSAAFNEIDVLHNSTVSEPLALGNATKIDVHVHAVPKFYFDIMPIKPGDEPWTVSRQFAHMANLGIAHSILSLPWPGAFVYTGNETATLALARITNEYMAQVAQRYPKRFSFMAVVPLLYVEKALKEVEYAVQDLGAVALGFFSNFKGHYLGAPEFDTFFSEFNALNLTREKVVFIHPAVPSCTFPVPNNANIEFYFDTATAFAGLTLSQTFHNYSNVKYIFAHGGGAAPSIIDRMFIHVTPDFKAQSESIYRKRVWYDSAGATYPRQLQGLLAYDIPKTQLLYGSDFPFDVGPYVEAAKAVADAPFLTEEERAGVFRKNALTLFPGVNQDESLRENRVVT